MHGSPYKDLTRKTLRSVGQCPRALCLSHGPFGERSNPMSASLLDGQAPTGLSEFSPSSTLSWSKTLAACPLHLFMCWLLKLLSVLISCPWDKVHFVWVSLLSSSRNVPFAGKTQDVCDVIYSTPWHLLWRPVNHLSWFWFPGRDTIDPGADRKPLDPVSVQMKSLLNISRLDETWWKSHFALDVRMEEVKGETAAAAAKSLQSCLPLCDPIDGSPPGSPHPWDSPGKNTGVGCHFLLQCRKVKSESEVAQSCPTLRDPIDCSPPGSSVHGIFQARALEWGAMAFSKRRD